MSTTSDRETFFITDQAALERSYAKVHPWILAQHIPTWELNGNSSNVVAAKAVLSRRAKEAATALGKIARAATWSKPPG